jgi:hypothetical protein
LEKDIKTTQIVAVSLASLILGAIGMFLIVTHSRVPKTWLPLSTDGGGIGFETQAIASGIPMPKISKPEGKAKFLDRDGGIALGYIISVPIEKLYVSTLPEKYRKMTDLGNGFQLGPPEQVIYFGHFDFTLKDADGFALMTLSSDKEDLSAGQNNPLQGATKGTVTPSIAKHTKSILVNLVIESCNPCDAK